MRKKYISELGMSEKNKLISDINSMQGYET